MPSSTDTNTIDLKLLDKQYAVADSGYIYDYQPTGERVEVYDKDDINGKRLVRVFK